MSGSGSFFLDTSAAVKLIAAEPESADLRGFLADVPVWPGSELLRVEPPRACTRRRAPALADAALHLLDGAPLLAMDWPVLERAAVLSPAALRSLDAIHLATALSIPGLAGMVAYDQRLVGAARQHGLRVFSPGQEA